VLCVASARLCRLDKVPSVYVCVCVLSLRSTRQVSVAGELGGEKAREITLPMSSEVAREKLAKMAAIKEKLLVSAYASSAGLC